MIKRTSCLALLILIGFESGQVLALTISDVQVSRIYFNPAEGESTKIQFDINEPASVEFRIYDGRDILIYDNSKDVDGGRNSFTWDGRDNNGQIVPPEAYRYILNASNATGEKQTFDLTDVTGGNRLSARAVEWDAEMEQVHYVLPENARVMIRIGLKNNGPLLRTLLEWVPRRGGLNRTHWDGWDNSRAIDLSQHSDLAIYVDAYSLSDNTLLVGEPPRKTTFVEISPEDQIMRKSRRSSKKSMYYHPDQPLESRGDISISLKLPTEIDKDKDGLPIINGQVPVQLKVNPKDLQRTLERRFEPVFYIDGIFAFENEVGYLPFTWIWDTTEINPGVHYITANLRGYDGNFGIATVKVRISKLE